MAVHLSEGIPASDTAAPVTVNIFNGAPGDQVTMRIIPGATVAGQGAEPLSWVDMAETPGIDPLYQSFYDREQPTEGQRRELPAVPAPEASHHLWSAVLPQGLPPGTHVLEIRHQNLYGAITEHRHTFRVTP